jgi:lipopolysaccharide export system permease protein
MNTLNRYLGAAVGTSCLIVLVAFIGLDIVFRIMEESDNIEKDYTFFAVIVYELLRSPARLYDIMPVVGLIGCLTGLGALANNNELIIIRSAGVSIWRMVWMAIRPTLIFMVVLMLVGEYIAPKAEQTAISYRAFARHQNSGIDIKRGQWIRDENNYIYVNLVQPDGVLFGLTLFEFNKKGYMQSITQAERATYGSREWLLEKVSKTTLHHEEGMNLPEKVSQSTSELSRWRTNLNPSVLKLAVVEPDDLGMEELYGYISYLQSQQLNSKSYEIAFWEKAYYPLVMVSLVLVGISFVFGPLREVTMGYRVFWGVMVGIVFKTLQDTLGPISIVFGFSPAIAMLLPVIVCSVLGGYFLTRVR